MFALSPTFADLASPIQPSDSANWRASLTMPLQARINFNSFWVRLWDCPLDKKKIIKHNSKKKPAGLSGLGRFFVANAFALR